MFIQFTVNKTDLRPFFLLRPFIIFHSKCPRREVDGFDGFQEARVRTPRFSNFPPFF